VEPPSTSEGKEKPSLRKRGEKKRAVSLERRRVITGKNSWVADRKKKSDLRGRKKKMHVRKFSSTKTSSIERGRRIREEKNVKTPKERGIELVRLVTSFWGPKKIRGKRKLAIMSSDGMRGKRGPALQHRSQGKRGDYDVNWRGASGRRKKIANAWGGRCRGDKIGGWSDKKSLMECTEKGGGTGRKKNSKV